MSERREFLVAAGTVAAGTVAGCLSSDDPEQRGSAFDATKSDTPDSDTPEPTEASDIEAANRLEVAGDYWSAATHITAYSADGIEATIRDDLDIDFESLRAIGFAYTYPRDEGVAVSQSEAFAPADLPRDISISIDASELPEGERLQYLLFVGRDADISDLGAGDLEHKMETDPFERDGGQIKRSPHPEEVGSESGDRYERRDVEGAYRIEVSGRTGGRSWSASIQFWKASYIDRTTASRGRSRPEYVNYEMTEGSAGSLARTLSNEAEDLEFTDKREQAGFVIDYIQALPYVPDDVSTGFDDYTKFIAETISEGGGDCEDTAVLMASVLQSEPFGYDTVLLQPPGHMAVGIYGKDLPGGHVTYDGREYYYIETTGEGWGVGDIPEQYQGVDVKIHNV